MKKIAVFNNKGGVGKTTIAFHLVSRAKEHNLNVLAIDFDRQGNLMQALTNGDWHGGYDVSEFEGGLVLYRPDGLNTEDISPDFDLVIMDCPPNWERLTWFQDSNWLIVPITGRWSINAALTVINQLKRDRFKGKTMLVPMMIPDRFKVRTEESEALSLLETSILSEGIGKSDVFRACESNYIPCWEVPYATRTKAVRQMTFLCDYVIKK